MWVVCVALALSAADAPRLEDDFEAVQAEVRLLDARLIALTPRMPTGYAVGATAGIVSGVATLPVAIGFTFLLANFRGVPQAIWSNAPWYWLAVSGFVVGIVMLVMGFDAMKAASVERAEVTRKRDAALLRLSNF